MFSIKSLFKICILTTFSLFSIQSAGYCSTNEQVANPKVNWIDRSQSTDHGNVLTYSVPNYSVKEFLDNFCSDIKKIQLSVNDLPDIKKSRQLGIIAGSKNTDRARRYYHRTRCKYLFERLNKDTKLLYHDAMSNWDATEVPNCCYKDPFAMNVFKRAPRSNNVIAKVTNVNPGQVTYMDFDIIDDVMDYNGSFKITYKNTKNFLRSYFSLKHFEFGYQLASNQAYSRLDRDTRINIYQKAYEFSGWHGLDPIYVYLRDALDYEEWHTNNHEKFCFNVFGRNIKDEIDEVIKARPVNADTDAESNSDTDTETSVMDIDE